jgi:hypothetical protein
MKDKESAMNKTNKERTMSPKGFLHKATTKAAASASAFIAQHRAWLESGELKDATVAILASVDNHSMMPTPALEEIKVIVLNHLIASEIRKGEESIAAQEASPETSKNWIATIYNSKGEVVTRINAKGNEEELRQSFDLAQEADRWTDRRLFDSEPDCYGVIQHTSLLNKDGEAMAFTIMRNDAIGRILQAPKGAVMKGQAKSSGRLGFGVKCKEDRSVFSRG